MPTSNEIFVNKIQVDGNGVVIDYTHATDGFSEARKYPANNRAGDYTMDLLEAIQAFSSNLIGFCGLDTLAWNAVSITEIDLTKNTLTLKGQTIHPDYERLIKIKSPTFASNLFPELEVEQKVSHLEKEIVAYLKGKTKYQQLSLLEGGRQQCS